jgi:hypothetical protein
MALPLPFSVLVATVDVVERRISQDAQSDRTRADRHARGIYATHFRPAIPIKARGVAI